MCSNTSSSEADSCVSLVRLRHNQYDVRANAQHDGVQQAHRGHNENGTTLLLEIQVFWCATHQHERTKKQRFVDETPIQRLVGRDSEIGFSE